MSDKVLQPLDATGEQAPRALDLPHQPFTVADLDAIPALVDLAFLGRVWCYGRTRLHELEREGAFEFLRVRPGIGSRKYSGVLLKRHLQGESVETTTTRTFGRKRV